MSRDSWHWRVSWRLAGVFGALVAACAAEGAPQDVQDGANTVAPTDTVPAAGRGVVGSAGAAGRAAAAAGGGSGATPVAAAGAGASMVMAGAAGGGAAVGSLAAGSGAALPVTGAAASSPGSAGAGGVIGQGSIQGQAGAAMLPGAAGGGAGAAGSPQGAAGAAASGGAITIWLAGDSTVAKGNTPCPVGWGAEFQDLFKPEAKVVNSAVGGRSVRTWLYEVQTQMDGSGECALNKDSSGEPVLQARWQTMLDGMKSGDFLFIQFGINDSSATCDRHVGIEAFKESYGMMAEAAKMRGAQPVFVTPVSAIKCEGATARPTRGGFVTATIDAGKTYDVPVIDLHERSIALYQEQGLCPIPGGADVSASTGGKTGAFFCDDHTHFSAEGAAQIAELMAEALKDEMLSLAAYLK